MGHLLQHIDVPQTDLLPMPHIHDRSRRLCRVSGDQAGPLRAMGDPGSHFWGIGRVVDDVDAQLGVWNIQLAQGRSRQ